MSRIFAILFLAAIIAATSAQFYPGLGYGGGYGLGYSNLGYGHGGYGIGGYGGYTAYSSSYGRYSGLGYYKK